MVVYYVIDRVWCMCACPIINHRTTYVIVRSLQCLVRWFFFSSIFFALALPRFWRSSVAVLQKQLTFLELLLSALSSPGPFAHSGASLLLLCLRKTPCAQPAPAAPALLNASSSEDPHRGPE
jgi:hypothetical protein